MDLIAGKIALITGGSLGIGAAYVKDLFKRGLKGCTITDIDESGEALAEEMNCRHGKGKAIFVKADVTNKEAFEEVFKTNMKKFDGLDLLVNNAGILRGRYWEQMIDVNITASVRGSLLGIKYMGKNNGACGGTIVNTSSIAGLIPFSGAPVYGGTKHFIIGFTRSMGSPFWFDLTGCRFMAICPGVTTTGMVTDAEQWVLEGFPGLEKLIMQQLGAVPPQTCEQLAEGFNTMLNEGENGSIWVSEEAMPIYEVDIPDRKTYKKQKAC